MPESCLFIYFYFFSCANKIMHLKMWSWGSAKWGKMQGQTEKCLVPEASVLRRVSIHAADCLCLSWDSRWVLPLVLRRQFWNSLLIVTDVQMESFCLRLRLWRTARIFVLPSPLWWHWTLFPLPADGCCSFHYQGEAGRDCFSCCWFPTD